MITIPASACSLYAITFEPVKVERGRKFKGFAYYIDCMVCHAGPYSTYDRARLWDPAAKRFVYANAEFCMDASEISDEQKIADKTAFIQHKIDGIVNYAKANCTGTKDDLNRFILNIAKKQFSVEFINAVIRPQLDINVDVASEVEKTLQWAMSLKTRPMFLYGKYCAGGKPLALEKKLRIALKALTKKGITVHEDFNMVWSLNCTLLGVSEKVLNKLQLN